jgi:hypothetical protein
MRVFPLSWFIPRILRESKVLPNSESTKRYVWPLSSHVECLSNLHLRHHFVADYIFNKPNARIIYSLDGLYATA